MASVAVFPRIFTGWCSRGYAPRIMESKMATLRDAITNMQEMIALQQKQIKLMTEMIECYEMADFLKMDIKDIKTVSKRLITDGRGFQPWKSAILVVSVNGQETQHKLTDVPYALWPQDMLDAYSRDKKRRKMAAV